MITSKINTTITLDYLCNARENQNYDRKKSSISETELANHIAGMANADGGIIAVGIADNGKIIGLNNYPNKINQFRKCIQYLNAEPEIKYEELKVKNYKEEDDIILLLHISISLNKLIRNQKDEVYLRRGDSTIKLTDEQIQVLKMDRPEISFEEQLVPYATIDIIDKEVVDLYKAKIDATDKTNEEVLRARGFLRESILNGKEYLTNAGVLLFAKDPSVYLPTARIRIVKFDGNEMLTGAELNIIKDKTFSLPLYKAIKEVSKFVNTQLKDFTHLNQDGIFETIPEYPEFTYVEGITNAVTHRNYVMGGEHIKIFIYDDRMEIRSPGKLAGLVTLENIKTERYSRNRIIARTLTEFGVVRELNEGISRIYSEMKKYFLEEPEFKVDKVDNFILTLKNNYLTRQVREEDSLKKNEAISNDWDNLSEMEKKILQFIADKGHCRTSEISRYIGRADSTTRKVLTKLKGKQLIDWIGTSEYDPKKVYKIKA